MAFGDTGGPVTELIVTMRCTDESCKKNDLVRLSGNFAFSVAGYSEWLLFGIGFAMADGVKGQAVPIKVRGVHYLTVPNSESLPERVGAFVGKTILSIGADRVIAVLI